MTMRGLIILISAMILVVICLCIYVVHSHAEMDAAADKARALFKERSEKTAQKEVEEVQETATVDVSGMQTALELFKVDVGRYPTTEEGLKSLVIYAETAPGWRHSYTDRIPVDPWGHSYGYHSPARNGLPYEIDSTGPDGVEGTADDIATYPAAAPQ